MNIPPIIATAAAGPVSNRAFIPYKLIFSGPVASGCQEKTVKSPQEQAAFLDNLSEEISGSHQYAEVWIESPHLYGSSLFPIELLSLFHERFSVFGERTKYCLGPKIISETPIDCSNKKRIEYANGVIEESEDLPDRIGFCQKRKGVRTYPDGRVERGIFNVSKGNSFVGVRSQEGCKDIYIKPTALASNIFFDTETNRYLSASEYYSAKNETSRFRNEAGRFSEVVITVQEGADEKNHLVALKGNDSEYTELERPLFEVILSFGQKENDKVFLKLMPYVDLRDFIHFLLSDDRLSTLGGSSFFAVLEQAQKLEIAIDLHQIDPQTHEPLFSKHAGSAWSTQLIQCMLNMDPTAIDQVQTLKKKRSCVSAALLNGNNEGAGLLIRAAAERKIELPEEDQWIVRVFKNDTSFSDDAFKALDVEFQEEIYSLANNRNFYEIALRLRGLIGGVGEVILLGPSLFAPMMDCEARKEAVHGFLTGLRSKGQLLTPVEFYAAQQKKKYRQKTCDIGRILGANYVESVATKLGLKSIKAPKKVAEIENGKEESLSIKVCKSFAYLGIESLDLTIWAEEISANRYYATYDEMVELVRFLEESCFHDCDRSNFILASDGIYIIDTEFTNFLNVPATGRWEEIIEMCDPGSQQRFVDYLRGRLAEMKKAPVVARPKELDPALSKKFGLENGRKMILNTGDILRL